MPEGKNHLYFDLGQHEDNAKGALSFRRSDSAIAEELAAKMPKSSGSAADVFACNSQSTNKGNNRSNRTALSSTKSSLIAKTES